MFVLLLLNKIQLDGNPTTMEILIGVFYTFCKSELVGKVGEIDQNYNFQLNNNRRDTWHGRTRCRIRTEDKN